jgi:hypothetical protein
MPCKKCQSEQVKQFSSELNVHLQDPGGFNKQAVLLFPKLSVCLECGSTEFTLSASELLLLVRRAEAKPLMP